MSNKENDEKTPLIPEQGAIYVYTNDSDEVVIRQCDAADTDKEHFVYIQRYNLPKLIAKLQSYVDRS